MTVSHSGPGLLRTTFNCFKDEICQNHMLVSRDRQVVLIDGHAGTFCGIHVVHEKSGFPVFKLSGFENKLKYVSNSILSDNTNRLVVTLLQRHTEPWGDECKNCHSSKPFQEKA